MHYWLNQADFYLLVWVGYQGNSGPDFPQKDKILVE